MLFRMTGFTAKRTAFTMTFNRRGVDDAITYLRLTNYFDCCRILRRFDPEANEWFDVPLQQEDAEAA